MKLFMVTSERQLSKKHAESRVVGFITTFGWEKPHEKAVKKYPHLSNFQVHASTTRRR